MSNSLKTARGASAKQCLNCHRKLVPYFEDGKWDGYSYQCECSPGRIIMFA